MLNYEEDKEHEITLRAFDSGIPSLTTDVAVTIQVEDVNDPPTALTISGE